MPLDPESSKDSAEGKIEIEQHWTLFDVKFQICGSVLQFLFRILHFFEIDPVFLERIDETNSVLVFKRARFVHVDLARAGGRTE